MAAAIYVIIGVLVKGVVAIHGLKFRRGTLSGGPLWDAHNNSRNSLFLFLAAADSNLFGILFQIFLWPLWVIWLVFSMDRVQKFFQDDNASSE